MLDVRDRRYCLLLLLLVVHKIWYIKVCRTRAITTITASNNDNKILSNTREYHSFLCLSYLFLFLLLLMIIFGRCSVFAVANTAAMLQSFFALYSILQTFLLLLLLAFFRCWFLRLFYSKSCSLLFIRFYGTSYMLT